MELLAPAGNWDALKAAVENGADAVYLGGRQFSARQAAANFSDDDISRALEYLHLKGRKLYVALNTIIDDEEYSTALDYSWKLYTLGVDALIIQDLGLMDTLRQILPAMRLHASTQMTVHNPEGVLYLEKQGVKRVVLAREMGIHEIQKAKQAATSIEIEVFVHGALCYCYSGQCLFSSMVGGRSGNRGKCAQPCRLPYELYSGKTRIRTSEGKGKYLLSPADLCLIDYLPELKSMGVDSLKIEGRMKRAEYVAVVTRAYREVMDTLGTEPAYRPGRNLKERLLKIFNRNFTSGYFIFDRQKFLSSTKPGNQGIDVGYVLSQDRNNKTRIKISDTVNIGDGLEIWTSLPKNPALTIKDMKVNGKSTNQAKPGDVVELYVEGKTVYGDRVYKTHDAELIDEANKSFQQEEIKIPVRVKVFLSPGQPIKIIMSDDRGNQVEEVGNIAAQLAVKQGLDETVLMEKISRLGNTPFYLESLELFAENDLIVPFSEVNETRRKAADALLNIRLQLPRLQKNEYENFRKRRAQYLQPAVESTRPLKPELNVMVSGIEQAYWAMETGADTVYIDLSAIGQRERIQTKELELIREQADSKSCRIIPVLPKIQKSLKTQDLKMIKNAGFNSVMVANIGALHWAITNGTNFRVDYSLNVFNTCTLRYLNRMGAETVCLSPELNYNRLKNIKGLSNSEIIIHGEIILMTSEYCMLRGILGNGEENCSHFCQKQNYAIRDQIGYTFPVDTDINCRFYVFNSRTLCLIDNLPKIIALGVGGVRIEARHSRELELKMAVKLYRQAIDELFEKKGKPDLEAYRQELERTAASSFTRGHFYRGII